MNEPSAISGTVVLPDGQPAAGAQVVLEVSTYNWAMLSHAKLITLWGAGIETAALPVESAQDGRFSFPPTGNVVAIVAVHEKGYVRVPLQEFANASRIMLQPWGRIEGVFRVGTRHGTNERVTLAAAPALHGIQLGRSFTDMTDADGKFVFTDVPPGTWLMSHGATPPWGGDPVTVKAGETNHVILGGMGRPVVGKLLVPTSITNGPTHPWVVNTRGQLEVRDSTTPGPKRVIDVTLRADLKIVGAKMESDGTFRLEDVTPGRWWLLAQIIQFPIGGGGGSPIALTGREVVVSEVPGGRSDEPLDLGTMEPALAHSPQMGEAAPLIEVKTEDGNTFKLAEHRGQYVLLHFEPASGMGDTRGLLRQSVESVWASFGKNGRLAMLTLEVPTMWDGGYGICPPVKAWPWPRVQLFSRPWHEVEPLLLCFGLQHYAEIEADPNLPVVFLVGADGRIIARDSDGDAIKAAVAGVLGLN